MIISNGLSFILGLLCGAFIMLVAMVLLLEQ